ncbi:pseudouridylate synthase transporter [Chlorella sorokiniana]|uniref:tRNA pseudouridine(55) synthase n=1 Tax=Chlorella sorokiniana TaxID=3076 RepID=A0A2P6TSQ4_CHLSO|nr:pseudouridylate synthase transporter [Chlorella sorokiniana]|eukprot:PRW57095.1 pseudouridylate synthase transporter [Chlorella sorokiniana]
MADQSRQQVKRQRLSPRATAADAAAVQQGGASPRKQQQSAQQQAGQQPKQQQERKSKAIVMPTPVRPPTVPTDPAAWENAVLLIDKPQEWTSFDVCGKLRGALAALLKKKNRDVKVGHAGTLDPMATGLLIVCVGKGSKAVDAFMAMTKEYSGTLRLGEGTPSLDAETPVDERLPWEHITDEELLAARDGFLGEIQQLPPMYSAIKVGGKKLYEAARKGKEVERQPRTITVERFHLRRDEADRQSVHFSVVCSKGTYIRSLAADLGRALGTAAHLTALRREAIGEYSVQGSWQIQDLADQVHKLRLEQKQQQQEGAATAAGSAAAAAGEGQAAATADAEAPAAEPPAVQQMGAAAEAET